MSQRPTATTNKWRDLLWLAAAFVPMVLSVTGFLLGLLLGGLVLGFRGGMQRLEDFMSPR